MSRRIRNIIKVESSWSHHIQLSTLKGLDAAIDAALMFGRAHHGAQVGQHDGITVRRRIELTDNGIEYVDEHHASDVVSKFSPRMIRAALRNFEQVTLFWTLKEPVQGTTVVSVTLSNSFIYQ